MPFLGVTGHIFARDISNFTNKEQGYVTCLDTNTVGARLTRNITFTVRRVRLELSVLVSSVKGDVSGSTLCLTASSTHYFLGNVGEEILVFY